MAENPLTGSRQGHPSGHSFHSVGSESKAADRKAFQDLYSLFDELPVFAVRKNLDGIYTHVSRKCARVLGTTPENAVGKTDYDFYSRQQAERYRAEDRRVIETGELIETLEEDHFGDETRYYTLRKGPVRGKGGEIVGVQAIFCDVTEQKVLEKALQDERDLLQTIMDLLPDFIYVKDRQGRYVVVNDGVRQVLGASTADEVIGKSNESFLPPDQAKRERIDDDHVIKLEQPLVEREEKMVDPDGNDLWILTSKLPLRDREGKVSGLVGIDRNITRLKAIESQLRSAKESADQANRAKSDFLANMSHEIRTPMNAIIGMTDLLLETQLTETQHDYLSMVQDSGESLLALINDILDFSKIESGKFELEHTSFDIRETIGDAMKSLGLRANKKGIELAVNIDPDTPIYLKGDPGRLRQVIVNLVGNAIKFTEEGEVVLELSSAAIQDDRAELLFAVTDTGIGIAPEQCEKIFREFEQAETSTTRRFGGTGLGLTISARLVALMGGRIWVDSEVGAGSTFRFTTELLIDKGRAKASAAPQVDLNGLRALVVDDNSTNRRILKTMLANWGIAPITASGAEQAFRLLLDAVEEQDPIGLVISDVNMPDVDGIGFAKQIAEHSSLGDVQIIMLTSGARPDDLAQLRSFGVEFQLMKPIKQSELFAAIVSTMSQESSQPVPQVAGSQQQKAASDLPEVPSLNILLAEDNVVNQKLAVGILSGMGHEITVVKDGHEAVQAVINNQDSFRPFDLVLMDVQMPTMDGHAATREIRQHEELHGGRLPIVAMTAHAMKGDRERCLEAGMDDYLSKPIRLQQVAEKLAELYPATEILNQNLPVDSVRTSNFSNQIDWDLVVSNVGGDPSLLKDIVLAFLSDTPRLMNEVEQAIGSGNWRQLAKSAHSLKGSLLFLDNNSAIESAEHLEMSASQENSNVTKTEFANLRKRYAEVTSQMEEFLAELEMA